MHIHAQKASKTAQQKKKNPVSLLGYITELPPQHQGMWKAKAQPPRPAGFFKAPPTPLANPRKQTISTFVNYMWKNGPVVSRRVNGASTIEGLAWIIPTLEGTGVGTGRVEGNEA